MLGYKFQFQLVRLRRELYLPYVAMGLFQFQLVRLRQYQIFGFPVYVVVSIPIGTIKTYITEGPRSYSNRFNSNWYD